MEWSLGFCFIFLFFYSYRYPIFTAPFVEKTFFSISLLGSFYQKSIDHKWRDSFLNFQCFQVINIYLCYADITVLVTVTLKNVLESSVGPQALFFQNFLAVLGPLRLHINFNVSLSVSKDLLGFS